jgi:hypothetical protein
MDKYAIFGYVKETRLAGYSNLATQGVDLVAGNIIAELKPVFGEDHADLGPHTKVQDILYHLNFAARNLSPHGVCLFYFHGHGDSIESRGRQDELKDEVLVCSDDYLVDDEIDHHLARFKPTQRLLTIVDSCSSETVIEWSTRREDQYPQIIHIASARDGMEAGALPFGGLFSRRLHSFIYGGTHRSLTYDSFVKRLEMYTVSAPCIVRTSATVSNEYLNAPLFT